MRDKKYESKFPEPSSLVNTILEEDFCSPDRNSVSERPVEYKSTNLYNQLLD